MTNKARVVRAFVSARYLRRWHSRAAIEHHQRRRLARHMRFLRSHSPYFSRLMAGEDPPQWADLPLMNKATMMANFDELNTVGLARDEALALAIEGERRRDFAADLGGCSVGLSSGTTGHRGLFVVSPRERDVWAGTVLALMSVLGLLGVVLFCVYVFLHSQQSYENLAGVVAPPSPPSPAT